MEAVQLEFFPQDEMSQLRHDMKAIKESTDKVRRGMFARHGELSKLVMNLNNRLDILEANICNHGKANEKNLLTL